MKIKHARFFQPIGIPSNTTSINGDQLSVHVNDTIHDIERQGDLVKITHRASGNTLYASFYNLQYMRLADEQPEAVEPVRAETAPKAAKKARKPDTVAGDELP